MFKITWCDLGFHSSDKWETVSDEVMNTERWSTVQQKHFIVKTERVLVQKKVCKFCGFIQLNTQKELIFSC